MRACVRVGVLEVGDVGSVNGAILGQVSYELQRLWASDWATMSPGGAHKSLHGCDDVVVDDGLKGPALRFRESVHDTSLVSNWMYVGCIGFKK